MADDFSTLSSGLSSPAPDAFAITPDDATDLANLPRAIYVGGTGNIVVTMGGDVTFSSVPAGTLLPIRPSRVKATGTTATNLLGLY